MMSIAEFNVAQSIQNTLRAVQRIAIQSRVFQLQDQAYFTLAAVSFAQALLFPDRQSLGISVWKTNGIYERFGHKYPDLEVEVKFDAGTPTWIRFKVKTNAVVIVEYDMVNKTSNISGEVPFNLHETPLVKIEAILALRFSQEDVALGFNFQLKKPFTMTARTARFPLWQF